MSRVDRTYSMARFVIGVLSVFGWLTVIAGVIVILVAATGNLDMAHEFRPRGPYGPGPGFGMFGGVLLGVFIAIGGVIQLGLAQVFLAVVDGAVSTHESLKVAQRQLDIMEEVTKPR